MWNFCYCRSKLVPLVDLNGWPSTTKFFALKKNWVLRPSLPERTSATLHKRLQVHWPEYHRRDKPTVEVGNVVIILFAQYYVIRLHLYLLTPMKLIIRSISLNFFAKTDDSSFI